MQRVWTTSIFIAAGCFAPAMAFAHSDVDSISDKALVQPAQIVDCTLENGDAAQCASYTLKFVPDDLEIGPFCPATLDDVGGIWNWDGENAGLYRIDGDYLKMLSGLGYTFYNDDGVVNVFDIRVEGPEAEHECIAGSLDAGSEMSITTLIPIAPVLADAPTSLGTVAKVGIALDGVPIFADAPSVLYTGHMPALDTCGGHVDPGGWYHWPRRRISTRSLPKTVLTPVAPMSRKIRPRSLPMPLTALRCSARLRQMERHLSGWTNAAAISARLWAARKRFTITTRGTVFRICRPV